MQNPNYSPYVHFKIITIWLVSVYWISLINTYFLFKLTIFFKLMILQCVCDIWIEYTL